MALQPTEPTVLLRHFLKCFPIPSGKEVNLPFRSWVVKSSESSPKKQKTFFELLVSWDSKANFTFNCSTYMWLVNKRMLSPKSQAKWTHQRDVPCLLYSLMYPWVCCQVLQFEKHRFTRVSVSVSVSLAQPHFLLFLSLLPPIVQLHHINCIPSTMCQTFCRGFYNFFPAYIINLHNTSPCSPLTTWSAGWDSSSLWSLL